ncbi:MAG: IS21-like element helper ATPase IstB [Candidatus Aenigmarchaeota archaeon]|nr:IS21-like element helper ATPase IstB [Candidatus Aenigmarchaeota archaeon]
MNISEFNKSALNRLLKEIHLPSIRIGYETAIKEAKKNDMSYENFLFGLIENEAFERRQRRTERLLKRSGIPLQKSIDAFDLKRLSMKEMQKVNGLLDGKFTERQENVLAFGNPGSGKTHLLCAIGQKLVRNGKKVYFSSCNILVQELLAAKKELKLSKILKKLSAYDALIIDDIGYVQQNREEMEVLFALLAERYEKGSVMISSNLPFSKWEQIFKDPMTTAAAIDRLVHHSVILELNLSSFRLEEAKKRTHKSKRRTKN